MNHVEIQRKLVKSLYLPDVVPQATAAGVLGKDRRYVHTLIKRGHIKPVKTHDGEVWVSIRSVRAWMDSQDRKRNGEVK